jgi:hypothetical protein
MISFVSTIKPPLILGFLCPSALFNFRRCPTCQIQTQEGRSVAQLDLGL